MARQKPAWCTRRGKDVELILRLNPRAPRDGIVESGHDRLRIQVSAPPVDDAANRALCKWLARAFGVAPSKVSVLSGSRSRDKRVRIEAPRDVPAWLSGAGG